MTPLETEPTVHLMEADGPDDDGLAAAAIARARDALVRVVGEHPRVSLIGAFVVGFALARLARKLGEDRS